MQAYLASTSFADAMVGRLLDALDVGGRRRDDHRALGRPRLPPRREGAPAQDDALDESTRVPLVAVAPGVTTPRTRRDAPVSLMGVYPTLAELAGPRFLRFTLGFGFDYRSHYPFLRQWSTAVTEYQKGLLYAVYDLFPGSTASFLIAGVNLT